MSESNDADREDLWSQILARLQQILPAACCETWFVPVRCRRQDNTLDLTVPNDLFRVTILKNYWRPLHQAVAELLGSNVQVQISAAACPSPAWSAQATPLPVVRAAALELPDQRPLWLVERLWTHQAVGVIGGSPKLGKTWLALDLAVSIASGTDCLGAFPVHASGPVLVYAAEDSAAALRTRLEALCRSRQIDFSHLEVHVIIAPSLRLDRLEDQERLQATLLLHRPLLLVLDPLVRVHAIDENVAGQVAALLGYLRSLQRTTGVAVALVHHLKKNSSSTGGAGYNLRGSSDLYAWLDSFLCLRKQHDQLTLLAEHRSAPAGGLYRLELAQPSGESAPHLRLLASNGLDRTPREDPLPGQILQLLTAAGQPMTVDSLRNRLQVRNQRVVEALRQLTSQGTVQRMARGYTLTTPPSLPLGAS